MVKSVDAGIAAAHDEAVTTPRHTVGRQQRPRRGPPSEVLAVAALVGETFSPEVVAWVCGTDLDRVLDELGDVVSAGGLRHAGGTFRFVDAEARDRLYRGVPLSRRLTLEARIAQVLEDVYQSDLESHAAIIAEHLMHSLPKGDAAKALHYSVVAGDVALRERRHTDAARNFGMALKAIDLLPDQRDERLRILLSLGEALVRVGDLPGAWEAYGEVAELARRWNRPRELVRAALGFGAGLGGFETRLFDARQIALLEEAAQAAEDDGQRALVLARLSVALSFLESDERRKAIAREAVERAHASGAPAALVQALSSYCDAFSGPESNGDRLSAAGEMLQIAAGTDDQEMELLARRFRVVALLEIGDVDGVDKELQAYAATANALGQPLSHWYVPLWRGMRAAMEAAYDEALMLSEEAATVGGRANSANAAMLTDVLRFVVLRLQGRAQEARDLIISFVGALGEEVVPTMRIAVAAALAEAGDHEGAQVHLDRAVAGLAELPRDSEWLPSMALLAETALTLADRRAAETVYDELKPFEAMFAVEGIAAGTYGCVARQLGSLAAFLGMREEASRHFDEALTRNRHAGSRALVEMTVRDRTAALAEAAKDDGATASGPNRFRSEGDVWTLSYAGRTVSVRDAKGMRDLFVLLRAPFRSFHVSELAAPGPEARAALDGAGDEVIDPQARRAYRLRLQELQEEVDEAEARNDLEAAARSRAEMEFLTLELSRALGIGGHTRMMNEAAEKVRKAVGARIRNSIERIEKHHPTLGRHLRHSVRTGSFCSYDPESPVDWET